MRHELRMAALSVLGGLAIPSQLAAAQWTRGEATDELFVAAGETYALTEADAGALGSKCLWVTGPGTVVGTQAFTNFTGSVRLSSGVYQYKERGGLGDHGVYDSGGNLVSSLRKQGSTLVIDGGTLENHVSASNSWNSRIQPSIPCSLDLHLSGTGFDGRGVIFNAETTESIAHTICLDADATVASDKDKEMQIRYARLFTGGHKLTLAKKTRLGLVELWEGDGKGDIEMDGADRLYLSGQTLKFADSTWSVKDTGVFIRNFGGGNQEDNFAAFKLRGWGYLHVEAGIPQVDRIGPDCKADLNRLKGDFELLSRGCLVVEFGEDGTGLALDGVVSGDGGFRPTSDATHAKYGWLRLSNKGNTFKGGVSSRGRKDADGAFNGGVSLLASGAAPADGGPIALENATLRLNNSVEKEQTYELPSLVVMGGGEVLDLLTRTTTNVALTAKGLRKTGDDVFRVAAPVAFTGPVDVQGGTLRLVPSARSVAGLNYYHKQGTKEDTVIHQPENYRGLDGAGVGYAYRPWTKYGSGNENDDSYKQGYHYEGYIRIPGEEGSDVTFNFATCLTRHCKVAIDDTVVADVDDGKANLAGTAYVGEWTRLGVAPKKTMKAGWHRLSVYMSNSYWESPCGPSGSQGANWSWPDNFGIGVDWSARCTTNSADYTKLEDGGTGTLLRWSMDRALGRAQFQEGVAFAPGAVFDLGDEEGALSALQVASLAGVPTVTNGALRVVSSEWTLRTGDVVPGKPLVIADGGSLGFGEPGSLVTVSVAPEGLEGLRGKGARVKILDWEGDAARRPANRFVASASLKSAGWGVRTDEDGVWLGRFGFAIILR